LRDYLDKPFAFYGHSLGALLSFELARELRRKFGVLPMHLFVSGRVAPNAPRVRPPIHALPQAEFLDELRRLNGTPKEVLDTPELLELIVPILRADFGLNEKYQYVSEDPLECPITAIGGLDDDSTNDSGLEAWREHTSAAFQLRMMQGDHFFINTAKVELLSMLSRDLQRLIVKATPGVF
jgi:surfactin synthase thioesterase subunit